ncbi:MAG TPA: hypothetical protein VFE08_17350 [Candidatus Sulfotelmatobacter sp.]|nr:hypothetical protein [Candidatus Sulfotelmatobacter sp.]
MSPPQFSVLDAGENLTYIDVNRSISLHRASRQSRWHFGAFEVKRLMPKEAGYLK